MNNQEENLINQRKWNSRRFLLFYWFAIVFVGTAAAAGLGTSVLSPKLATNKVDHSSLNLPSPFSPTDCMGSMCHNDTVASWNETGHSEASILLPNGSIQVGHSLYNDSYYKERSCTGGALAGCHSTGWDNTTKTFDDYGVTCAACHEEPGVIDYANEGCQKCHVHEGSTQDYQMSAHNNSYEDLLKGGYAPSYCMHCMTGQGLYSDVTGKESYLTSINCATCHDPHDATNDAQMREAEVTDLCGTCHGSTAEVFEDSGNKHLTYADEGCATCHGYQEYVSRGSPSTRLNHTWAINFDQACGQCHTTDAALEGKLAMLDTIHGDFETLNATFYTQLANVTDKVDDANETAGVDLFTMEDAYALIEEAEELVDLIEGDASRGFHNPTLMENNLKLALSKLNEAYAKAETAMGGETGTTGTSATSATSAGGAPGFQIITILAAISILSTTAVLFRRKGR